MANTGPLVPPVPPAPLVPQATQALQAPQQHVDQPVPTQPIQHMPQLNWSHFKPKFAGKPEEDAEAHLLRTNDWIHTCITRRCEGPTFLSNISRRS